jgi:hypothetical protein
MNKQAFIVYELFIIIFPSTHERERKAKKKSFASSDIAIKSGEGLKNARSATSSMILSAVRLHVIAAV